MIRLALAILVMVAPVKALAQFTLPPDMQPYAESAQAYIQPLADNDCHRALPHWREAVRRGGAERAVAGFVALRGTQTGAWGPCFSDLEDRQTIVSVLADMATGRDRDAQLVSGEFLALLVGADWLETMAKTGDIRFVVLAAEAHAFCAPQGDIPFIRTFQDHAALVAKACKTADTPRYVGGPDLDQGLFWYALAFRRDAWPEVVSSGRLSGLHSFVKVGAYRDYPRDPLTEINARGLELSSPKAYGIQAHFVHETFVQDFVHRGSAARFDAAKAKADGFVPVPLDLRD